MEKKFGTDQKSRQKKEGVVSGIPSKTRLVRENLDKITQIYHTQGLYAL